MKIVQIFGLKNSQSSRAAERFFKERGVPVQFVDLKVKPMAPAEIGRFIAASGWLPWSIQRANPTSMRASNT